MTPIIGAVFLLAIGIAIPVYVTCHAVRFLRRNFG
jgi:hypothetical protein